jgi:predicted TIM-barrel fold metal-dependent hydrolase
MVVAPAHDCRQVSRLTGAVAAAAATGSAGSARARSAKWSTGTECTKLTIPPNACDCHHHIIDGRFRAIAGAALTPPDALISDYRALQGRIGTTRNVVVQPSTYGVDNRLLMETLAAFGQKTTRGIAVVDTSVTDVELKQLDEAGVRGIRFNLAPAGTTTLDMVRPLARRIAPLGWHVQIHAPADTLFAAKATWIDLPVPIAFDHLGRIPMPAGISHPTYAMICDLLHRGKAWVKLSGLSQDSKVGPPSYSDTVQVAKAYVKEARERMVWGSNWPHPSEQSRNAIPDDALLIDRLADCAPDDAVRTRILVDNAAELYQFA